MVCKSQREQKVPEFRVPNNASIHTLKHFWDVNKPFQDCRAPAVFSLHPKWAHMDPMALVMSAAWGGWCRRQGLTIEVENVYGRHANYAARMKLFEHFGISHYTVLEEHEEAGRFLPIERVRSQSELESVIGNVSALLHLDTEPDALAAVQYCVSELIRNVLEHSQSREGAYVCAQRYLNKNPKRVSIAVADCGLGIAQHIGQVHPRALRNDELALRLAMQPGVSGAHKAGIDGLSPDNAGAGLFITRAIAKATGGYFVLMSGTGAFRLRRCPKKDDRGVHFDAFTDPRKDLWKLPAMWQGTVAAVEVVTEEIPSFSNFFKWIIRQIPAKKTTAGKIKFT